MGLLEATAMLLRGKAAFTVLLGFQHRRGDTFHFVLEHVRISPLTKRGSSQSGLQGLGHRQVAAVSEGRLDQLVLHSQVLEAIVKFSIGHLDGELLQDVRLLGVEVEAHLAEPLEGLGVVNLVFDQGPGHVPLVHQLCDLGNTGKVTRQFRCTLIYLFNKQNITFGLYTPGICQTLRKHVNKPVGV